MDEGRKFRAAQEKLPIDRQRGKYAKAFPGQVIDLMGNGIELPLAVAREIGALG